MAVFRFRIAAFVCSPRSSPPTSEKSGASATWPAKWTTRDPCAIATWLKPGAGCRPGGLTSSRWGDTSGSSRDPLELGVRDEAALLDAERLHLGQHVGALLLGDVDAELVGLDPDRVEAALLAQHDAALGADQLARIGLDRRRVVEL